MYRNQRERIPDLLESPNSRRDLRNSRISNDHLRRYEPSMTKYERSSPHPHGRLAKNTRVEKQLYDFQAYSSSDECLTRNKSKSTSSIDTQSVNNILDEFEDLNYRKSSDLSDFDVGNVEVTNFEEILDIQKRQVIDKQNSRVSRPHNHVKKNHQRHQSTSPTKISRQTQVQQRSRDRQRDREKGSLSPPDEHSKFERKSMSAAFLNSEVRSSIRSAKAPPEVILRKGEVQRRVDEWLSQTRNQNCVGYTKESRGLTRSNSSAEQKSYRRMRQQEMRSRRSQLNGASSYDDLTQEELQDRKKITDGTSNKVSVGINTSRGTYKQYLAMKNKARLEKQQQQQQTQPQDKQTPENEKVGVIVRSRESSPAPKIHHQHSRSDSANVSFRSNSSKRFENPEQPQQQYFWTGETTSSMNSRSKNARAKQMEARISSLVKARNEMSNATAAAINRRASFKNESSQNSSKSLNATDSSLNKEVQKDLQQAVCQDHHKVAGIIPAMKPNNQQINCTEETKLPKESNADLPKEVHDSVGARIRTFQSKVDKRIPKTRSLQGSNILIETRNRSPMSPNRNKVFNFKEIDRNQSTFKPNSTSFCQQQERCCSKNDKEIDSATRNVEIIYETSLQPEVIHADDLESVFKPVRTNFVYGERLSKDLSSEKPILKKEIEREKRKTLEIRNNDVESKSTETAINQCLKLLQRSPSFRIKRSHNKQKEKDNYTKLPMHQNETMNGQENLICELSEIEHPTKNNLPSPKIANQPDNIENPNEQAPKSIRHYESRSTLKLNNCNNLLNEINNETNLQDNNSANKVTSKLLHGTITCNSLNHQDSSLISNISEKMDQNGVVNEVLIKNLQFKQDLPSSPPTPPPRNYVEPTLRRPETSIIELNTLRNKPFNYNNVLDDNYQNSQNRNDSNNQVNDEIYLTKEEMQRKNLMHLLRKGEYELVKMVSLVKSYYYIMISYLQLF